MLLLIVFASEAEVDLALDRLNPHLTQATRSTTSAMTRTYRRPFRPTERTEQNRSTQQIKEMTIFHRQGTATRERRCESGSQRIIEILNVVVDDKETRIGIGQ